MCRKKQLQYTLSLNDNRKKGYDTAQRGVDRKTNYLRDQDRAGAPIDPGKHNASRRFCTLSPACQSPLSISAWASMRRYLPDVGNCFRIFLRRSFVRRFGVRVEWVQQHQHTQHTQRALPTKNHDKVHDKTRKHAQKRKKKRMNENSTNNIPQKKIRRSYVSIHTIRYVADSRQPTPCAVSQHILQHFFDTSKRLSYFNKSFVSQIVLHTSERLLYPKTNRILFITVPPNALGA